MYVARACYTAVLLLSSYGGLPHEWRSSALSPSPSLSLLLSDAPCLLSGCTRVTTSSHSQVVSQGRFEAPSTGCRAEWKPCGRRHLSCRVTEFSNCCSTQPAGRTQPSTHRDDRPRPTPATARHISCLKSGNILPFLFRSEALKSLPPPPSPLTSPALSTVQLSWPWCLPPGRFLSEQTGEDELHRAERAASSHLRINMLD